MPCTGPVQQEALAQTLRQRTASEYRKTRRGRSPCGHSARAREPRRGLIKIKKRRPSARRRSNRPAGQCPKTRRGPQGTIPLRYLLAPRCRAGAVCAATPIGPDAKPRPLQDAERPAGGTSPAGLSRRTRRARIEKRPPRARRPALPQPGAAVLSAKAGLTAGFGMGPGDPRLCGRARGGRSPAAHDMEPARSPHPGRPWRPHGGHGQKTAHRARCFPSRMRRARAISAARLSASPRLHLRPIDQVVYLGPYRKVDSSRRRLPA